MINSQQISFVMMIKLKWFKCAQTEWIDNKTMKSIRVEDFFCEETMMFSHFLVTSIYLVYFLAYTTTTNRQPDTIMKWNRVVFLSFASFLMNQLHQMCNLLHNCNIHENESNELLCTQPNQTKRAQIKSSMHLQPLWQLLTLAIKSI